MSRNLRILHCLRAPVGGLFRHVVDLAREQAQLGHNVGIIHDRFTQSDGALKTLGALEKLCRLGIRSVKMPKLISPRDYLAFREVKEFASEAKVQILHGHGAKGGAYARLAANELHQPGSPCYSVYTPHGGSLHYSPSDFIGRIYLNFEKRLTRKTKGIIFESEYSAQIFDQVIGRGFCRDRVIPNGLTMDEFRPITIEEDASDFVFVGELRKLKGVDLLLQAIEILNHKNRVTLSIVGDGPDETLFRSMSKKFGISDKVRFLGRLPARTAFGQGHCVVVPSRAESFPYIVLEACAAARPLIATDVGGISEIITQDMGQLVPPDNGVALAEVMDLYCSSPDEFQTRAEALQSSVQQRFTVELMAAQITDFYLAIMGR